ncbi:MAG: PaaI family thioesterase [Legionellales bacterium]|jgi:acyl-coenzyme A thioesterase PaaI-like protein
MQTLSLQEHYSPNGICFGCGPKNDKGLQVHSFVQADGTLIATWQPKPEYQAFPNVLCGGVIGSLLDCHCNWAATWFLMQYNKTEIAPHTVTAEYTIKLKRPTPIDEPITLIARLEQIINERTAITSGELISHGKVCATCTGKFIAVKEEHPAFFGD